MEPLNDSFSMSTFADLCGRRASAPDPAGAGCNLFQPGTLTGSTPQYMQYDSGNPGYETDWNNFAPNVGMAWRPNVQNGLLRTLLGDPDQATIRAGYSVAFTRDGWTDSRASTAPTPGAASTPTARGTRATSCSRARPGRCTSASRTVSDRRPSPTAPRIR